MSDATVKEAKRQDGLARTYKDYLIAVIIFIIGFAVFMYGYGNGRVKTFPLIIGWIITGGPVLFGLFMSKRMDSLLFWKDYEVITTYSDGSKESDHGAESSAIWLFGLLLGFLVGGLIAFLRIVWLTIKSITYYVSVKEKPSFLSSPFPVLLLFLVGFVLAVVIPTKIRGAQIRAIAIDEPEIVQGSILIADNILTKIYTEAGTASTIVRELNRGDTLTATGKVTEKKGVDYIPVDHNGTRGWVYRYDVEVDMPAIATAAVSAETTMMYRLAVEDINYAEEELNKGHTVKVIGKEKNGFTPIEAVVPGGTDANGNRVMSPERGFVKTEDLTVQGGN